MNLHRAIEIALDAHKNVSDKGGNPYILHPLRLMLQMDSEEEMIVAILHDVVEDSEKWSFDKLKSLVGVECIYAVSKVLDSDFIKTKCKITDSLFNQLRIQ